MTERELIELWTKTRWHIVISQLAPTALLGFTVWLGMLGLGEAALPIRIAAVGILLASGILGSLAQFSAASEGLAIARDLRELPATAAVSGQIIRIAPLLNVVRFVTPAVFVVVFVALFAEMFLR
ncbi:MAG: hypothetical protein ACOH1U_06285 [Rhodoglobus sp.]